MFFDGASTDFRTATINNIESLHIFNFAGSNREAIFNASQFTMTTVTNGAHVGQTHQVSLFMDTQTSLDISAVTFTGFTEPGDQVNITGDTSNETITGASNVVNNIDGGGGDDTIEGGTLGDTLNGGAGTGDTLSYAASSAGVNVNLASGLVSGGDAAGDVIFNFENITGSASSDNLVGSSGNNILQGGDGADQLNGLAGTDSLFGGNGNDLFDVIASDDTAGETYDGGADNDTIRLFGDGAFTTINLRDDTFTRIESINFNNALATNPLDAQILASQFLGSVTTVSANADVGFTNTLSIFMDTPTVLDLSGVTFTGFTEATDGVNITGDGDAETITGSSIRDTINAGGGDDTLNVGAGITAGETYDGGADTDELNFTALSTAHTVNLQTGVFDLVAGGAASTVANIEIVRAGSGNDVLERSGFGMIFSLFGGLGNDRITVNFGVVAGDTLDGGMGTDTLDFSLIGTADHRVNLALQEIDSTGGGFLATAANFENINAGDGNDNLTGDSGVNIINGGGGNDTIDSGEGQDIINGEAGNDTVRLSSLNFEGGEAYDGGADTDTIQLVAGSFYSDASLFDLAAGTFNLGGPTTATFVNFENYDGSAGTAASSENVTGTAGTNIITTAGGTNTIDGGSDGADILSGGGGDDIIFGGGSGTVMNGGAGNDTLTESTTFSHSQTLNGDAGNDLIIVGFSAVGDLYDGGADVDTVDFQQLESFSGETIDLSLASFSIFGGFYSNFENVNDTDNSGGNTIIGSAVANILNGNGGSDTISGGGGSDTINGGDGDDTLNGGTGVDTVDGGAGTDTLDLSGATNTQKLNLVTNVNIGGFAHNDTFLNIENVIGSDTRGDDITGTAGANILSGMGADDLLRGFNGDDTLNGGDNNDFLFGGNGADTLNGDSGLDWAMYNGLTTGVNVNLLTGLGTGGQAQGDTYANIERVRGSSVDDTITGDNGINKLLGDDGADTINGMGGKDVIRGGDGDDTINGGAGNDGLRGDAGSDTFIFELGSGHDFVIDFENNIDTLNIDDNLFAGTLSAMDLVNDHMVMENANRFHFDFGNGDVLHVLTTTAMVLGDFYDDVTIV